MAAQTARQALTHVLEYIARTRRHIGDSSFEEFREDDMLKDAVSYALQCASEAAHRLRKVWPSIADELEARHPAIPWVAFRELRNRTRDRSSRETMDAERYWKELAPDGLVSQVESAVRSEYPFAHIP